MTNDPPSGEAYARDDDPDTAHEAADFVEGEFASRQEKLVLSVLEAILPNGLTSFELAERVGVLRDSISPRFCPLARKNLIHDSGERRAKPTGGPRSIVWKHGPGPLSADSPKTMITAFYHIGPVNHWREIVSEQLRLLGKASFPGHIYIHFGGDHYEQGYIQRVANVHCLPVTFLPSHPNREECPCLEAIQRYVSAPDPTEHVLYFHTKGITHLNEWHVVMWRWLMNASTLTHWKESVDELVAGSWDFVAPKVSNDPFPHSSGNYWIARSEYLRMLPLFKPYYDTFEQVYAGRLHGGWSQRHAAEAWVGSGLDVRACQLSPFPMEMWHRQTWVDNPEAQLYATRYGS